MNKYQLYRLIGKNADLKTERHPMLDKNRFMKFLMIFMWLYYAAILIFMGVVMAVGMKGSYNGVAAFHVFDGGLLYLLICDFWFRFGLQETPAQNVQSYALLPIRRSFLMNVYLSRAGLTWGNLYWFFLLVPFGLIAIAIPLGWIAFFGWLLGWWLLLVANGYAYLFCRALIMKHMAWLLLPIAIHGALLAIMLVPDKNPLDMPCTVLMYDFLQWKLWPFLLIGALIALLYWANYKLQMGMVYDEVAKKEEKEIKHATQLNFLNRFGRLGEYFKLEVKQRLRNNSQNEFPCRLVHDGAVQCHHVLQRCVRQQLHALVHLPLQLYCIGHDDASDDYVLRGQLHRRTDEPPRKHPAIAHGKVLFQRSSTLHSTHHPVALDDYWQDVRLDEHRLLLLYGWSALPSPLPDGCLQRQHTSHEHEVNKQAGQHGSADCQHRYPLPADCF